MRKRTGYAATSDAAALDLGVIAIAPPKPEELARRRKLFVKTMRLREEIGPVDLTIEELLAEDDEEAGD